MKRNLNIFLLLFLLLLCLPATIAAAFSDVKSSDWFAADVGDMTAEGLNLRLSRRHFPPRAHHHRGGVRLHRGAVRRAGTSGLVLLPLGRRDHAGGAGGGVV